MRTLIIQQIVHTPADMGSMKDALVEQGKAKLGEVEWEENQKRITEFWDRVDEALDKLEVDWNKVRIYQDGMPVGGDAAAKMVEIVAGQGSRNYQIIKKAIEKGAVVEETESKELLLEEYGYVKKFASAPTDAEKIEALKSYKEAKDELLKKRDAFIAERVDQSLKQGETGILFIGAHHRVQENLPKDIKVEELN